MSITGRIKTLFSDAEKTEAVFPRTKIKAVSDDSGIGLNVLIDSKQNKHIPVGLTLNAANWTGNSQKVVVEGVTTDNTLIVTAAPESITIYGKSGVYCSAQENNALTFVCNKVPDINLNVNVLILN